MASLKLLPDETLGEGLQRIAAEQIDAAMAALERTGEDAEEGVHEARVACKKLRALYRAASGGTGKKVARRGNALFRDIARGLSGTRDAHVMVRTSERLGGEQSWPAVHRALGERLDAVDAPTADLQRVMAVARAQLLDCREETVAAFDVPDKFEVLAPGLAEAYTQGRSDMKKARSTGDGERYHDWRKRVKDLGYMATMLRPLWPAQMKALSKELGRLGDLLGEEHDAAILEAFLRAGELDAVAPADQIATAAERLLLERRRLRAGCIPLGLRIYAESPKDFSKRMEALWKAARRRRRPGKK